MTAAHVSATSVVRTLVELFAKGFLIQIMAIPIGGNNSSMIKIANRERRKGG